ncbi:MAG: porin family protein [Phocaeicola sp.]
MKRLVVLFFFVACLGALLPLHAQFAFGVKGGMTLSSLRFSSETFSSHNRNGWFVGPMAEFTIPVLGLGIEAAGLYTQNKLDANSESVTMKTIEVPVNLKWTLGLGKMLGIYLAAGPQFGFNLGNNTDFWQLKKNNTSFNVGAGLKLIRHLQLGATYNFALSNVAEIRDGEHTISVKQNGWQISAAYTF